jgi:hypothetical protein
MRLHLQRVEAYFSAQQYMLFFKGGKYLGAS